MKLWSDSIRDGQPIPAEFAYGKPDGAGRIALSDNRNPHLAWDGVPAGTRSFVLLCIDPDVPTVPATVNREDAQIPADQPRTDFVHWVMTDIPADCRQLAAGSCSHGVTVRGKRSPAGPAGAHQGLNDYTDWFAGDADMSGDHHGYDGPCPPFNDQRMHRYFFRLYALDVPALGLSGRFGRADVERAMQGHVLAEAAIHGTYTTNARLAG